MELVRELMGYTSDPAQDQCDGWGLKRLFSHGYRRWCSGAKRPKVSWQVRHVEGQFVQLRVMVCGSDPVKCYPRTERFKASGRFSMMHGRKLALHKLHITMKRRIPRTKRNARKAKRRVRRKAKRKALPLTIPSCPSLPWRMRSNLASQRLRTLM